MKSGSLTKPIRPKANAAAEYKATVEEHRNAIISLSPKIPSANITFYTTCIGLNGGLSMPIRSYRPADRKQHRYPTLIFIPGSAFVGFEFSFTDVLCSHISEKAKCQVIIVYHRLAPEHPFPIGYNDTYSLIKSILQDKSTNGLAHRLKIDPDNVAISGYSSGGNFAALAAIDAKRDELSLKRQVLISPAVDLARSTTTDRFAEDQDNIIGSAFIQWFIQYYLPKNVALTNPRVSPYWTSLDNLAGVAPASVHYGEFDRFKGDSKAYAIKLRSVQVPVDSYEYPKQNHAFAWWQTADLVRNISSELVASFGTQAIPKSINDRIIGRGNHLTLFQQRNNHTHAEQDMVVTSPKPKKDKSPKLNVALSVFAKHNIKIRPSTQTLTPETKRI